MVIDTLSAKDSPDTIDSILANLKPPHNGQVSFYIYGHGMFYWNRESDRFECTYEGGEVSWLRPDHRARKVEIILY